MSNIQLFAGQEVAVNGMVQMLLSGNYALLKAGQRSGKSLCLYEALCRYLKLVLATGHQHVNYSVVLVSELDILARTYVQPLPVNKVELIRPSEHGDNLDAAVWNRVCESARELNQVIVIMDEAMWVRRSYDAFSLVRQLANVKILVASSKGPEFYGRWSQVPGLSFNTWDMNPLHTQESLLAKCEDDLSRLMLMRDYCAF